MNSTRLSGLRMLVMATLMTPLLALGDDNDAKPQDTIVPNPVVQAQIKRAVEGLRQAERTNDHVAFLREMVPLIEVAQEGAPELMRQVLYFDSGAKDVLESMMLFMVIHYGKISKFSMVQAVAPLLGTSDPKLKAGVREVAGLIMSPPNRDLPNYEPFRSCLRMKKRAGDEIELNLIEFMYRGSPGQALLTLADVFAPGQEQTPILWAEHVVADTLWKQGYGFIGKQETEADAIKQLESLSKCSHWWAQLYVAEIMRQEPEFRTTELIERLKQDKHPLVRKTIEAFTKNAGHE